MRKLAIVVLLVMASCKRQVVVSSAPASQPPAATANPNAPGGGSPRAAIDKFMQAAKQQDVQAMSNVWGTSRGPARTDRTFMTVEDMEQRIIYMMRCLRHDTYLVLSEQPATGGERISRVQLKLGSTTAVSDFTTTPGPDNRFYVRTLDLETPSIKAICIAK